MADFYIVTETRTLIPDAKGNYFYAGEHNGKPYYRREDGAFIIWWAGTVPYISVILGDNDSGGWYGPHGIIGEYYPDEPYDGDAYVAAGQQNVKRSLVNGSLAENSLVGKGLVR